MVRIERHEEGGNLSVAAGVLFVVIKRSGNDPKPPATEEDTRFKPESAIEPPAAETPKEESVVPSDPDVRQHLKEAIQYGALQQRDGLVYQGDGSGSYSGWVKEMYDSGQVKGLMIYKDGVPNGAFTWWHENGRTKSEGTFSDGQVDGLYTEWHENGQQRSQRTYRDGRRVSAKYWNSRGVEVETLGEAQ